MKLQILLVCIAVVLENTLSADAKCAIEKVKDCYDKRPDKAKTEGTQGEGSETQGGGAKAEGEGQQAEDKDVTTIKTAEDKDVTTEKSITTQAAGAGRRRRAAKKDSNKCPAYLKHKKCYKDAGYEKCKSEKKTSSTHEGDYQKTEQYIKDKKCKGATNTPFVIGTVMAAWIAIFAHF